MRNVLTENIKIEKISATDKEKRLSFLDEEDGFITFLFSSLQGFNVEERRAARAKKSKISF